MTLHSASRRSTPPRFLIWQCLLVTLALGLAGCGSPARHGSSADYSAPPPVSASPRGQEVTLFALGLMETGYQFGGKHPQAGLDCSGMVSYVYGQAAGMRLSGSAADLARSGRPIERDALRPGDLVFFNTRNQPFSHVGIYIGDMRFVHAPGSKGKVRIDRLDSRYFQPRYEAARTYFD